MLAKVKTIRSPTALAGIAESVGDSVVLSETLSMGDAVAMAWDRRNVASSRIRRIVVPAESEVTPDGSFALRAVVPFRELLEGWAARLTTRPSVGAPASLVAPPRSSGRMKRIAPTLLRTGGRVGLRTQRSEGIHQMSRIEVLVV